MMMTTTTMSMVITCIDDCFAGGGGGGRLGGVLGASDSAYGSESDLPTNTPSLHSLAR